MALGVVYVATPAATASSGPNSAFTIPPSHVAGNLDCNGFSKIQRTILPPIACTDIRGSNVDNANTWGGRFYDNGHYIGHDEPDMTFFSSQPGSGSSVNWSETLPKDPTALPTVATPGSDVTHWFELSVAPWFGMDLCDGNSYPQTPCTPNSDANAPSCSGTACPQSSYPGGGSAFLEMQFYPPGDAPFIDSVSCNNTSWCASLHINELECTLGFVSCASNCEETTNFAFVQTNGVPTGPPSPQLSDNATSEPNSQTLLMKPGDQLKVKIWDAPAPAVPKDGIPAGKALEVSIDDVTSGQTGFMQASAANGFTQTDIHSCGGRFFNYEPEYSTSKVGNIAPWAALQSNISTEFEIGHFTPCTTVTGSAGNGAGGAGDPVESTCVGPYEAHSDSGGAEGGDVPCFTLGDTHGTLASDPNEVNGCLDLVNGDLDFDGSPYWPDWPTSASINQATSRTASSFVQAMPTTNGHSYPEFMFQTDSALSESNCSRTTGQGCSIPPTGPEVDQPGHTSFYPFWSLAQKGGTCTIEFGNVTNGVNDFGRDAQYGTEQGATLGYPEFEGNIYDNTCPAAKSQGYFLVGKAGQVVSGGDAPTLPGVHGPTAPVVGIAATSSGKGYFAVTDTGSVSTGGDAPFEGDLSTLSPPAKVSDIVGIAPTPDFQGYWLVGADGGVFRFGDAKYYGSLPGRGIQVGNVVGMAGLPSGKGYWLVGSDGGVFSFGAAHYYGSLPGSGVHVNDIRGTAPAGAGTGYLLVGADGGAFSFGHGAPYRGSLPGQGVGVSDIVGIALTSDDAGYWMAGSNGIVYPFGDARSLTSDFTSSDVPITGITAVRTDLANVGP